MRQLSVLLLAYTCTKKPYPLTMQLLYVANEGLLLAVVAESAAEKALQALQSHPDGTHAAIIGTVVTEHPGMVTLESRIGGSRVVSMLPGEQLPRIC
jgi:hydrogenase expression/formation protein HypE